MISSPGPWGLQKGALPGLGVGKAAGEGHSYLQTEAGTLRKSGRHLGGSSSRGKDS